MDQSAGNRLLVSAGVNAVNTKVSFSDEVPFEGKFVTHAANIVVSSHVK